MGRVFLDTSVLVYADDADAPEKRARAQAIIRQSFTTAEGVISTQVLQEYFVVATRKLKVPIEAAQRKVELFATMSLVTVRTDQIFHAIRTQRLHQLSFWDSLIIESARAAGCKTVLSEDLGNGRSIEGVTSENPFR